MSKTVHYLCFYANQDNKDVLTSYPSVWSKIEYISEKIKNCGYSVNLFSAAPTKQKGFYHGNTILHKDGTRETYVSSFRTKYFILNKLSIMFIYCQIIYRLLTVDKDDIILVYHSMFYDRPVTILKKLFRKNFVLEIEDVYSELSDENKYLKQRERRFFELPQAYLCVNDLIAEKLENNKKKIISYGRYDLPPIYQNNSCHEMNTINLIYAGVIERQRGAAFLAIDAMKCLEKKYKLHICGFGDDIDLKALYDAVKEYNDSNDGNEIIYHGMVSGEKYYKLLQSCQIALSTHKYSTDTMSSADSTFPSKVLVYLSNGLHVVAQRLKCLQSSKIGSLIHYYDEPTAGAVADAIHSIDLDKSYDSRSIIHELDIDFQENIKLLLEVEI